MARIVLEKMKSERRSFNKEQFKRLGGYLKPYKKSCIKNITVFLLSNIIFGAVGPYLTRILSSMWLFTQIKTLSDGLDYSLFFSGNPCSVVVFKGIVFKHITII